MLGRQRSVRGRDAVRNAVIGSTAVSSVRIAALAGLMLVSVGCRAANTLGLADAAYAQGDLTRASTLYANVERMKPTLLEREGVGDRKARADAAVALDRAIHLERLGRDEDALGEARTAASLDAALPGVRDTVERLTARVVAAHLNDAVQRADRGDAPAAEAAVRAALRHQPTAPRALAMQAGLKPSGDNDAIAALERGYALARERRLAEAAAAFREAVSLDDTLLAARVALADTELRLASGRGHRESAERSLAGGDATAAAAEARLALEIWSDDEAALRLLASAEADTRRAERLVVEARAAAAREDWDAALDRIGVSRGVDSGLAAGAAAAAEIRGAAARAYVAAARRALQAGDDAAAAEAARAAKRARPGDASAAVVLSDVYASRGSRAEADGDTHRAIAWYTLAHWEAETPETADARARLWRSHTSRAESRFSFGASPGDPVGARVQAAASSKAAEAKSDVAVFTDGARTDFRVEFRTLQAEATPRKTSSIARQHRYAETVLIDNPEYSRLQREIDRVDEERDRAVRDFELRWGHTRRERKDNDRDRERALDRLESKLDRLDREIDRARRRLDNTPPQIERKVQRTHAYTMESWTLTARLEAQVLVFDEASGELMTQRRFADTAVHRDTRIVGAAPNLGLAADELDLPEGDASLEVLARSVGVALGASVPGTVLRARVESLRAAAAALAAAGDAAGARDARLAAIVAERRYDPAAGKAALAAFIDELGVR